MHLVRSAVAALCAVAMSVCAEAHAATFPGRKAEWFATEAAAALDAAGILHEPPDVRHGRVALRVATARWHDADGEPSIAIDAQVADVAGVMGITVVSDVVADIRGCANREVMQRVLLDAPRRLGGLVRLECADDDTVHAVVTLPMGRSIPDQFPAEQFVCAVRAIACAVDAACGTLAVAHEEARISWLGQEAGPGAPVAWLRGTDDAGEAFEVGWAPWFQDSAYAAELLAADGFCDDLAGLDAAARDRFAEEACGDFSTGVARPSLEAWREQLRGLEQHPWPIAFRFWGPAGTPVSVQVRAPGLMLGAFDAMATIGATGCVDVRVTPRWDVEALRTRTVPLDVAVHYEVSCGEARAGDFPKLRVEPFDVGDRALPAGAFLATFVDELHPWVLDVIAAARDAGAAASPYATEDMTFDEAVGSLRAVWNVFRAYDIRYDDGPDPMTDPRSQRVRTFGDVIADRLGNCADLTAAFASVMLALGYEPVLCLLPDHAFLGIPVHGGAGQPEVVFLETTMLGKDAAEGDGAWIERHLGHDAPRGSGDEWIAFADALETGSELARRSLGDGSLLMVQVEWLRAHGVHPFTPHRNADAPMPAPPDQVPILARRADARRAKDESNARELAWTDALPPVDCVAYPTVEALERDVMMINHDPVAMARLLSAVNGDLREQRCMRLVAGLRRADGEARRAMAAAFAPDEPYEGIMLNLPDYPLAVHAAPLAPGHLLVLVDGPVGERRSALPLIVTRDGYAIDGTSLCIVHPEVGKEAVAVVRQVDPQLFVTPGAFDGWARWSIELACSGYVATFDEMIDLVAHEFVGLLGGPQAPQPPGTPMVDATRE
jgi:hypothetical protein